MKKPGYKKVDDLRSKESSNESTAKGGAENKRKDQEQEKKRKVEEQEMKRKEEEQEKKRKKEENQKEPRSGTDGSDLQHHRPPGFQGSYYNCLNQSLSWRVFEDEDLTKPIQRKDLIDRGVYFTPFWNEDGSVRKIIQFENEPIYGWLPLKMK